MSNLELAVNRLNFDDLLEAVQDSKRGRWFLKEYETRIQHRDTSSILSAISKLETRMESFGAQASNPDDLSKVRSAIANARNDLFKLGLGQQAMSKEGRMFAELADLARKVIPAAGEQNEGIVRTLQLVDEIDRAVSQPSAEDKGAKFFAADSNLFDRPVAVAKPVLVETPAPAPAVDVEKPVVAESKPTPLKKEETVTTGAKLVIRKTSQAIAPEPESPPLAVEPEPVIAPAIEAAPGQTPLPMQSENPRIVIIRRKAEDMPEVDIQAVSAA